MLNRPRQKGMELTSMSNAKPANIQARRRFRRRCSGDVSVLVMGISWAVRRMGNTRRTRNQEASFGAVVQLWNGGGEGRSHSRPFAPSHTLASACFPPRMVLMMM